MDIFRRAKKQQRLHIQVITSIFIICKRESDIPRDTLRRRQFECCRMICCGVRLVNELFEQCWTSKNKVVQKKMDWLYDITFAHRMLL